MREEKKSIPERLKLEADYQSRLPVYEEILLNIVRKIKQILDVTEINASIKFRVKSFESYFNKLLRRLQNPVEGSPSEIHDILGVRIICPFLSDIDVIEKLICSDFELAQIERKGIEQSFREFGYKSIHMLIKIPPSMHNTDKIGELEYCEIQLLTTLQDAWSEVEHELVYKSEFSSFDLPLKRKLAALNANLTLADIIFQEIRDYQREMDIELKMRRDTLYKKMGWNNDRKHTNDEGGKRDKGGIAHDYQIINEHDDSLDTLLLKAITAHNEGRFDTAVELYTRLLTTGISSNIMSVIYNHRGLAYFVQSDFSKAIEDFNMAVSYDEKNFRAYNYRGLAHRMVGDHACALADLNSSLKINPYQSESYYSRALVYYDIGDIGKAIKDCEYAINLDPKSENYQRFLKVIRKEVLSGSD